MLADARALEETVNRDLFAVWMRCNYPPGVPSPQLRIETEPPEDEKAAAEKNLILAQTIQSLAAVGYKADVAAVSKMFGLPLTYEPPPEAGQVGPVLELAELPEKPDRSDLSDALEELFGPAADAADRIVEILDDETLSEEERRERLRGIEFEITGGSGMETLMTREMEKRYAEGKNRGK